MADPSRKVESESTGVPRWVWLAGIIVAVVVLLFVAMMVMGMLGGGGGGHQIPQH